MTGLSEVVAVARTVVSAVLLTEAMTLLAAVARDLPKEWWEMGARCWVRVGNGAQQAVKHRGTEDGRCSCVRVGGRWTRALEKAALEKAVRSYGALS